MAIVQSEWQEAIRPLPKGHAHIAIGDVHGRADLLVGLNEALVAELALLSPDEAIVIYLGDLIDKGRQSRQALAIARQGLPKTRTVVLLGNHEDRLLQLLEAEDQPSFSRCMAHGGSELFEELGIAPNDDWRSVLEHALGASTLDWLRRLPVIFESSGLVYVHAGIDTGRLVASQSRRDLLWIREPWTSSVGPYENNLAFIHGHSPIGAVDLAARHRINLDTGAYATGILSALLIFEDRMKLISTFSEARLHLSTLF